MHTTDLYFESHVTIEPVTGARQELFEQVCANHSFRPANLVMVKANGIEKPNTRDAFCTSRHVDYDMILKRTKRIVFELKSLGFDVHRFKIENTLLDSKVQEGLL